MNLEPIVESNTERKGLIDDDADGIKYNTTMTVNALHLAILAKQTTAVELIMNYLAAIEDEQQFSNTLDSVIGAKLVLDFHNLDPKLFSTYDRTLHGMNAFHLSCQYHPEAIDIMFDKISRHKHEVTRSSVMKLVQANDNLLKYTPLHIASKKSLINATR